jgi:hypothetical protein
MYHTHRRPDRDSHVKIVKENLHPHLIDDFAKCSGENCCCDNVMHLPYDCDSVMHYAKNQGSKNGKDTIGNQKFKDLIIT